MRQRKKIILLLSYLILIFAHSSNPPSYSGDNDIFDKPQEYMQGGNGNYRIKVRGIVKSEKLRREYQTILDNQKYGFHRNSEGKTNVRKLFPDGPKFLDYSSSAQDRFFLEQFHVYNFHLDYTTRRLNAFPELTRKILYFGLPDIDSLHQWENYSEFLHYIGLGLVDDPDSVNFEVNLREKFPVEQQMPETSELLGRITKDLTKSQRKYAKEVLEKDIFSKSHLIIVNDESANASVAAFKFTSGTSPFKSKGSEVVVNHIFVNTGLVSKLFEGADTPEKLQDAAHQLAGVIAHEMAHPYHQIDITDKAAADDSYAQEGIRRRGKKLNRSASYEAKIFHRYGVDQSKEVAADLEGIYTAELSKAKRDGLQKALDKLRGKPKFSIGAGLSSHPHGDIRQSYMRMFLTFSRYEKGKQFDLKKYPVSPKILQEVGSLTYSARKGVLEIKNISQLSESKKRLNQRLKAKEKITDKLVKFGKDLTKLESLLKHSDTKAASTDAQVISQASKAEELRERIARLRNANSKIDRKIFLDVVSINNYLSKTNLKNLTNPSDKAEVNRVATEMGEYLSDPKNIHRLWSTYLGDHETELEIYKNPDDMQKQLADVFPAIEKNILEKKIEHGVKTLSDTVSENDFKTLQSIKGIEEEFETLIYSLLRKKPVKKWTLNEFNSHIGHLLKITTSVGRTLWEDSRLLFIGSKKYSNRLSLGDVIKYADLMDRSGLSLGPSHAKFHILSQLVKSADAESGIISIPIGGMLFEGPFDDPSLKKIESSRLYKKVVADIKKNIGHYAALEYFSGSNFKFDWESLFKATGQTYEEGFEAIESHLDDFIEKGDLNRFFRDTGMISSPISARHKAVIEELPDDSRFLAKIKLFEFTGLGENPEVFEKYTEPDWVFQKRDLGSIFDNISEEVADAVETHIDTVDRAYKRESVKFLELEWEGKLIKEASSASFISYNEFKDRIQRLGIPDLPDQLRGKVTIRAIAAFKNLDDPSRTLLVKEALMDAIKHRAGPKDYGDLIKNARVRNIDFDLAENIDQYARIRIVNQTHSGEEMYRLISELENEIIKDLDKLQERIKKAEPNTKQYRDLKLAVKKMVKALTFDNRLHSFNEFRLAFSTVRPEIDRIYDKLSETIMTLSPEDQADKKLFAMLVQHGGTEKSDELFSKQIRPIVKYTDESAIEEVASFTRHKGIRSEALKNDVAKGLMRAIEEEINPKGKFSSSDLGRYLYKFNQALPYSSRDKDAILEDLVWRREIESVKDLRLVEKSKSYHWHNIDPKMVSITNGAGAEISRLSTRSRDIILLHLMRPNEYPSIKAAMSELSSILDYIAVFSIDDSEGSIKTEWEQQYDYRRYERGAIRDQLEDSERLLKVMAKDGSQLERLAMYEFLITTGSPPLYNPNSQELFFKKYLNIDFNSAQGKQLRAFLDIAEPYEVSTILAYMMTLAGEKKGSMKPLFEAFKTVGKKAGQRAVTWKILADPDGDLRDLKDHAIPMSKLEIKMTMEKYLSKVELAKIDVVEEVLGSASIKTVARVRMKDGSRKAIVLISPSAEDQIKTNIEIGKRYIEKLDELGLSSRSAILKSQVAALEKQLLTKEADLSKEYGKVAKRYKAYFKEVNKEYGKASGKSDWNFSTPQDSGDIGLRKNVALIDLAEGVPFDKLPKNIQKEVGPLLVRASLHGMFKSTDNALFDADRHMGNFLIDPKTKTIHFVDLAQTFEFNNIKASTQADDRFLLSRLFLAMMQGNTNHMIHFSEQMQESPNKFSRKLRDELKVALNSYFDGVRKIEKSKRAISVIEILNILAAHDVVLDDRFTVGAMTGLTTLSKENYVSLDVMQKILQEGLVTSVKSKTTPNFRRPPPLGVEALLCTKLSD